MSVDHQRVMVYCSCNVLHCQRREKRSAYCQILCTLVQAFPFQPNNNNDDDNNNSNNNSNNDDDGGDLYTHQLLMSIMRITNHSYIQQ